MHAAKKVMQASEERSRQQFASRPSETSVQGMTLQQVNDTSAAALHTMAEAQQVLGSAADLAHPSVARSASQGHSAVDTSSIPRDQDDLVVRATGEPRHPTPTRDTVAQETGSSSAAAGSSATEGLAVDELGSGDAPQTHDIVQSRYDADVSDDDDEEATAASDSAGASQKGDDGGVEGVQQGMQAVRVADSSEGQSKRQVGVSAETLESVELEGSEDDSSDQGEASDAEGSPRAGGGD